jgi:hypothetical protein
VGLLPDRGALSADQYQTLKKRLSDQAAAERMAGIACWTGTPPGTG